MSSNITYDDFVVDEFQQRRRKSSLRRVAARFLCRYAGLTQREVTDVLKIGTGAAISCQLRKLAVDLEKDRRLRRRVEQTEERLEGLRRVERLPPAGMSPFLSTRQRPRARMGTGKL